MDALYFRVSSERQTSENQFEDLLQVAERDGSGRDWPRIRGLLADCVYEEQVPAATGRPGRCTESARRSRRSLPANAFMWSNESRGRPSSLPTST